MSHHVVGLLDVASWQRIELIGQDSEAKNRLLAFRPGIPSLQRGAVWKPKQVEMLWDSLMRGFPIGAFIVSDHTQLSRQVLRAAIHANTEGSAAFPFTHHLLDGQQRANAIALGFIDPSFATTACLWIDLLAKPGLDRRFVFRMTTKAHPWGYDKDFNRLGTSKIREALGVGTATTEQETEEQKRRYGFWPAQSVLPIPVYWLLKNPRLMGMTANDALQLFVEAAESTTGSFGDRLIAKLKESPFDEVQWKRISMGIKHLLRTQLIALDVDREVLESSDGESEETLSHQEGEAPPSNVEHLFTRLNSGGTTLDGAELAYSLVKSYWPRIEARISKLPRFDSEARLSALAFRDALSIDPVSNGFERSLTIAKMRRMALDLDEVDRSKIICHLGLEQEDVVGEFPFKMALDRLTDLLEWTPIQHFGLHPYLRNDLFGGNSELALLLLHLVRKSPDLSNEILRRRILGLATALHWFSGGSDSDRLLAADRAARYLGANPERDSFRGVLSKCHEEGRGIISVVHPDNLDELYPPFDRNWAEMAALDRDYEWTFWKALRERQGENPKDWRFVERLKSLRRLVLYSQRAYIGERFGQYDSSDILTWEDHNRPWDFDHILPTATLYYKQATFKKSANQLLNSIGNLRAWPFVGNRSKQDEKANMTILGEDVQRSFLEPDEVDDFSRDTDDFSKIDESLAFLNAARSRLLRMYRDWFDTLHIGFLMGPTTTITGEQS